MAYILGTVGLLCIAIGGLSLIPFPGVLSVLVFIGGWILVGLFMVIDELSSIRKFLKSAGPPKSL